MYSCIGDLYRVLGSKMSLNQPSHHHHQQQQQQQQETAVVQLSRPSIANMLHNSSSVDDDDSDLKSPRRQQTHIDNADRPITTSKPADDPKNSDASKCSISGIGDRPLHGSVSSTNRSQKQAVVASLQNRTVSQMFSRQSEFGSMISGLNYSLPQLNNIDNVVLYASQNGLNRAGDSFCGKRLSGVENPEPTKYRQAHASSMKEFYNSQSEPSGKVPEPVKNSVEEPVGRQQVRFEGDCKNESVSKPSRYEEGKLAEFTALEERLRISLNSIDQQLENIQTTCTSLSSSADLETLDGLLDQFVQNEQQLIQLTAASGEVMELTDSVEVVKAIQGKVTEMTSQVAVTRKRMNDTRTKVQAIFDERECHKMELHQLVDWLSETNQRLSECTERTSVNTVTAEQQLGQLLSLVHEFNAHRSRFQDLENCSGLEHNSVVELVCQFERLNEACRVSLERHRRLFGNLSDIRSNIQTITGWVAKVGPLYSLDSGSACGSLNMLEENHAELEHQLEEAAQLKEKATEFLSGLRTTEGQDGQGREVKGHLVDESHLMQPLLEVQCQMYQLRDLIATRAANTVYV